MLRTTRLLCHAAVLTLCANAVAGPKTGWEAASGTTSFSTIAVSGDDTINPLRGYHRWQNQELVPQSAPAPDAFRRYYWRDLETAEGQYNFSAIIADMNLAKSQGRKFAFRLRMMAGYDDDLLYAPAWLVNHPACASNCGFWGDADPADPGLTWVPDWNDPYLIDRSRKLLSALAAAIGPTDSIAWIDVGVFGQYGEWALLDSVYNNKPAAIAKITDASKREYAKMHFDAFPTQQHVMFFLWSNTDALKYGLNEQAITTKPVGQRIDCLAQGGFFNQWVHHNADWLLFANQWQKAPFVAEFCPFETGHVSNNPATARQQAAFYHISTIGNANFALSKPDADRWGSLTPAEQQDMLMLGREAGYRYGVDNATVNLTSGGQLTFTTTLRNLGNAPAYEPWTVKVELVNSSGVVTWSGPLNVELRTMTGGGVTRTVQGSWALPALASGAYTVRLAARDPRTSRAALKWVVNERGVDGTLLVRTIRRR